MIKAIIVDDEPLAREGIELNLQGHKDVSIVAQCQNPQEAISAIRQWQPDLVFLDIKMPGGTGFDVVKTIGAQNMPLVIFLTAYDQFAIDAFKINALDYLLKPINPDLFDESLNRVRNELDKARISEKSRQLNALLQEMGLHGMPAASSETHSADQPIDSDVNDNTPAQEERIIVRSSGHVHFIKPEEIIWVQADGDYIQLNTANRNHLIRETMRNMEQRLETYGFQRIHRSVIVRVAQISEMITSEQGDYEVVLQTGQRLKMSRQYRETLFQLLNAQP